MLQGERVLLRPMREEDIPRQHEFSQDRGLYGLDCDYPRVWTLAMTRQVFKDRTEYGDNIAPFAIEVDGKYVGMCSLMNLKNRHSNVELGITIGDREYWNRGYGRETVKLLLHYGFHYLGIRRVNLTTHAKNERAIRCYLACGFVEEGRPRKAIWVEGEWTDLVEMSILRDEWEEMRTH